MDFASRFLPGLRHGHLKLVCALLVLLTLAATPSLAQTSGTGSIQGTVTDPTDSIVAGATVAATNTLTGVKSETTTNAEGRYVISLLQPGPYALTFTSGSFAPLTQGNVVVDALAEI